MRYKFFTNPFIRCYSFNNNPFLNKTIPVTPAATPQQNPSGLLIIFLLLIFDNEINFSKNNLT